MLPSHYEYTSRSGDSVEGILRDLYGCTPHNQPITYQATLKGVLALNPHLATPRHLRPGTLLRLPEFPTSAVLQQVRPIILKQQGFLNDRFSSPEEKAQVTALAWLARNSNWLTIPGSITTGTAEMVLGSGNRQLLTDIGDSYADYRKKKITRTAYRAMREQKLAQFRNNIGPVFENLLYPKHGVMGAMRRRGGLLPPQITGQEVARLQRLVKYARNGGLLLTGVGAPASCIEIANTVDQKEKNEILVDTIGSTLVGVGLGYAFGMFLASNPVGWGTAIVLAAGSAAASWSAGQAARYIYDTRENPIDLVGAAGIDKVCR